jgi:hypothetical protein
MAVTAIVCCILSTAFAQQKLTIHFANKVGDKHLQLFTETYENGFGETFTINRFKYYISNIVLIDSDAKQYTYPNDYYLIDAADSASRSITISTNAKRIVGIQFLIGVDSIKNVTGVQTGALDPMNGMFWTWNSGYVYAKLEGVSIAAKVPGNLFSQHIGGFKNGENATRQIKLAVDSWRLTGRNSITIKADLNKWFQSSHTLKISQQPICHSPGDLAIQFADNYASMFSISTTN